MKRDIRIIGLDLDGTTLNSKKEISPRVRAALTAAAEAGMVVLPATGRTLNGIPQAFLQVPGVHYALASNGAKVYYLPQNKTIYSDCFAVADAAALVRASNATGAMTSAYIDGEGYCELPDYDALERVMPGATVKYMRENRIIVKNLPEFVSGHGRPVEKLALFYASAEARDRARGPLMARSDCLVTSSFPNNWELNTLTADKGEGLLALGRILGCEPHQIMAMGDGLNDVDMLRKVGYAVAMGNAEPEVKAVADEIAPSCEEDGVAVVIERLLAGQLSAAGH